MQTDTIEIGDVVTLKSEPTIKMTTIGIKSLDNSGPTGTKSPIGIECAWYYNGKFETFEFPKLALNKAV